MQSELTTGWWCAYNLTILEYLQANVLFNMKMGGGVGLQYKIMTMLKYLQANVSFAEKWGGGGLLKQNYDNVEYLQANVFWLAGKLGVDHW